MTAADLRMAEARHKRASLIAEHARQERNTLVLDALHDGWTHAAISEATGLSRGRISQMAMKA